MFLLRKLTLRSQIIAICSLFLLPITLLLTLLLSEQQRYILFTEQQLRGAAFLETVLEMERLAHSTRPQEVPSTGTSLTLDADQAERLNVAEQSAAATAAWSGWRETPTTDTRSTVQGALADLRQQVTDTSNLILDPRLESYYLMDVVTRRLPSIRATSSQAVAQIQETRPGTFLSSAVAYQTAQQDARIKEDLRAVERALSASMAEMGMPVPMTNKCNALKHYSKCFLNGCFH